LSTLSSYYNELPGTPQVVVITTRTVSWLNSQNPSSSFLTPTNDHLTQFSGMDKFSSPFFVLVKSWPSVDIYEITGARATIGQVWFDDSFSNGWSTWYLDGAYKYYSSQAASGILNITVQAGSSQNAWTGVTQPLFNTSEAVFLKLRYKIDVPSYALEILLFLTNSTWIIFNLNQSPDWTEQTFALTQQEAASLNKIGIVLWTNDTAVHVVSISYVLFGDYLVSEK
jgi:hypothetical protein